MNRTVPPNFYGTEPVFSLPTEAKFAYAWLLTSDNTSMCGVNNTPPEMFTCVTKLPAEWLRKTEDLLPHHLVRSRDGIWVVEFMRVNFKGGDALKKNNCVVGVFSALHALRDPRLLVAISANYPELVDLVVTTRTGTKRSPLAEAPRPVSPNGIVGIPFQVNKLELLSTPSYVSDPDRESGLESNDLRTYPSTTPPGGVRERAGVGAKAADQSAESSLFPAEEPPAPAAPRERTLYTIPGVPQEIVDAFKGFLCKTKPRPETPMDANVARVLQAGVRSGLIVLADVEVVAERYASATPPRSTRRTGLMAIANNWQGTEVPRAWDWKANPASELIGSNASPARVTYRKPAAQPLIF